MGVQTCWSMWVPRHVMSFHTGAEWHIQMILPEQTKRGWMQKGTLFPRILFHDSILHPVIFGKDLVGFSFQQVQTPFPLNIESWPWFRVREFCTLRKLFPQGVLWDNGMLPQLNLTPACQRTQIGKGRPKEAKASLLSLSLSLSSFLQGRNCCSGKLGLSSTCVWVCTIGLFSTFFPNFHLILRPPPKKKKTKTKNRNYVQLYNMFFPKKQNNKQTGETKNIFISANGS